MSNARGYSQLRPRRVRLAAVVAAVVGLGVSQIRGEDKPAEIPPDVVAKATGVLKKAAVLKRKQLDSLMVDEIASAEKDVGLGVEAVKSLQRAAAKAEDAAQEDFVAQHMQAIRDGYAKSAATSVEWLDRPNAASIAAGTNPGDGPRFTGPLEQPAWKDEIARTLTPEQLAAWRKVQTDREASLTKDITTYLDAQTGPWRERAESPMHVLTREIIAVLTLPTERTDQINALAKRAVDASLEAWRRTVDKYFRRTFAGKSASERGKFLRGQGFFMSNMNADAPDKQAVWTDGLVKLLTDDERAHLQASRDSHKTRRIHAFGQLVVAVLDEKIALTVSQRERLEPMMERLAQTQTEFFPNASNNNGFYYALQLTTFYKTITGAKPEELQPILDDLQRKRWQTLGQDRGTSDNDDEDTPRATPAPAVREPSGGEPEDMELAVSDYLQTRAAARYQQVENVMVLQAEDATRDAGLEASHAARLQTAARGSAEAAVAAWEPSMEQNTRAQIQGATPENIQQKLGSGSRYWYERSDPQDNALWKKTVDAELTPPQRTAWTAERDARSRYGDAAVAGFLLAEFDRKFSLLPSQWDKLAPAVAKALQEYGPDIRRMFSNSSSAWYLTSYYMFLPLMAIPENEFKPLLSREQWDQWTGSQEFSFSNSYWENIRRTHDQRAQQKKP